MTNGVAFVVIRRPYRLLSQSLQPPRTDNWTEIHPHRTQRYSSLHLQQYYALSFSISLQSSTIIILYIFAHSGARRSNFKDTTRCQKCNQCLTLPSFVRRRHVVHLSRRVTCGPVRSLSDTDSHVFGGDAMPCQSTITTMCSSVINNNNVNLLHVHNASLEKPYIGRHTHTESIVRDRQRLGL